MSSFNKIISTSSILVINLFSFGLFAQISSAQDVNLLNMPLSVENPESKEDFLEQCIQNLEANGVPYSQASSYCDCSADAVYQYSITENSDITSEAIVLEDILQCREQHVE